jgi:two-component system chemotaxis sensor kinase CheA
MDELLEQFVVESRELADEATARLLELEQAPQDAALLDAAFRALHTLKGGAGIVEFAAMERAMHAAEDLLGAARSGHRRLDAHDVGACLACLDQVLQWMDEIEAGRQLPGEAAGARANQLIDRLAELSAGGIATSPADAAAPAAAPAGAGGTDGARPGNTAGPDTAGPRSSGELTRAVLAAQLALVLDPAAEQSFGHLASAARSAANALHASGATEQADRLHALVPVAGDPATLATASQMLRLELERLLDAAHDPAGEEEPATAIPAQPGTSTSRTLRVEAGRIDRLVRLAGELIVAKNALAHLARLAGRDANPLAGALKTQQEALDHLGTELQRAVLQLRVLPLRAVFQRFPRLLREMSASLGKPVELHIHGEDTEADKAIVEMLFEPLLHVVRNALDHGIEPAEVRAARGKPATARLELRAARQGDQVLVEVRDDGGGFDVDRIRGVAAERGMLSRQAVDELDDEQAMQLVFAPGFSTASGVTALSGRGVGMDAVRNAVERLGGRISLQSTPGVGSSVRLLLPFSVMMTTVMSLEAGGQMFGVPLESVVETLRVPVSDISGIGAARAIVVRDRTVPLVDLAQMLGATPASDDREDVIVVIATFAGQPCGLQVDAIGERLEVILKPLEGLLAGTPGIAGTTLTGDGRVLLVLDVAELLHPAD